MNAGAPIVLPVRGMSCASCVAHVERALAAVPGVGRVSVNLATESASLSPAGLAPPGTLSSLLAGSVQAVRDAGYEIPTGTVELRVDGAAGASDAERIGAALRAVAGVVSVQFDLAEQAVRVTAVEGLASAAKLARAVEAAGFGASPAAASATAPGDDTAARASRAARRNALLALAACAPLAAPMLLHPFGIVVELPAALQWLLASFVQFWCARGLYRPSLMAIRARTGNMDLLVALGSLAAYGLSLVQWLSASASHHAALYFESSAVLIALVLLGRSLEAGARRRTASAMRLLARLRPATARVLRGGALAEVALDDVRAGELVVVRPGERIPVDGIVELGEALADESLLTGESLPVRHGPGDKVICGSTLAAQDGAGEVRIRTSAAGDETVLASIIRLVEQAQAAKAPIQRLVDRVAAVFVPAVLVLALATLAGWLLTGHGAEPSLLAAVSVLVIACPCALGLATPTAIIAGTGAAARMGILVRDAETMERARAVTLAAFDKTGTMTLGRLRVAQVLAASPRVDEPRALRLAAAASAASTHPIANALREAAPGPGIDASDAAVHAGLGVSCTIEGRRVLFGQLAWLEAMGADAGALGAAARALEEQGQSVSWLASAGLAAEGGGGAGADGGSAGVGADGGAAGGGGVDGSGSGAPVIDAAIGFADTPRPQAADAVRALADLGVDCALVSGDSAGATARVAQQIGVAHWQARVSPAGKVESIEAMRRGGAVVAMVGDGINDAPALAAADVGIAMGSGTDVAMSAAGIVLMRADPRLAAEAIRISRATVSRIRENLFWAFIYNAVGIPLAALGLLNPMIAAGAMALSSLSVVSNSLRLTRVRPAHPLR